jgi:hypothetical protein
VGKKSRKNERKPRSTRLYLDMGKPVVLNHFTIGKNGSITVGSVSGQEQPIASYVITTYERDKGHKVINRLTVSPENLTFVPNEVLTHYACILAVDTNKPIKELPNVFFTGVVPAKVLHQSDGRLELQIYQESVAELHNLNVPYERFGWSFVCTSVIDRHSETRVAVIVDSDLKSIPSINRRDEPILDDCYLPNGFELLYASSDTGSGYIANDLIRRCDRNTREVARQIVSTKASSLPPLLPRSNSKDPFTHIRIWNRFVNSVA